MTDRHHAPLRARPGRRAISRMDNVRRNGLQVKQCRLSQLPPCGDGCACALAAPPHAFPRRPGFWRVARGGDTSTPAGRRGPILAAMGSGPRTPVVAGYRIVGWRSRPRPLEEREAPSKTDSAEPRQTPAGPAEKERDGRIAPRLRARTCRRARRGRASRHQRVRDRDDHLAVSLAPQRLLEVTAASRLLFHPAREQPHHLRAHVGVGLRAAREPPGHGGIDA